MTGCQRHIVGAHGCFDRPLMQVLGGRFLQLAGTNVVSDRQPVDVQEAGDDADRDLLGEIFPNQILFAGEFGDGGEPTFRTA